MIPSVNTLPIKLFNLNLYLINNKKLNFIFFLFINNLKFDDFYKTPFFNFKFIKIKYNYNKLYKNLNKFRKFTLTNKYIFTNKLKYTKFLTHVFLHLIRYKNIKFYKNSTFLFIKTNYFNLNKNWNFLIGNIISPYYWNLFSKKKWIRTSLNPLFIKNNLYFKKNKKLELIKFKKFTTNVSKKLILENFFYMKKINTNYNFKKILIKLITKFKKKNSTDWFFSKPYLFLNNYRFKKTFFSYSNSLTINFYKKHTKFFYNFKKYNFQFRLKNSTDISFSQNFKIFNFIKKSKNNKYKKCFNFIKKHPILLKYKFNLFKVNLKLKIRNKKSLYKIWKFNLINVSKILKKNKFINRIDPFILKKSKIKYFKKLFFKIIIRLPKKIKKLKFKLILNSLFKITTDKKLNWYKKNKINFFTINEINSTFSKNLINFQIFKIKSYFMKKIKLKINLNLLKKLKYFTKRKTNFLLKTHGFLFLNNNITSYKNIYNFKKFIFSFPYKNELYKHILKKYIKSVYINIFNNTNKFLPDNGPINKFFKNENNLIFLLEKNTYFCKNWFYFNNQIQYYKNIMLENSNFIIKRVKFKPGYSSLWRNARNSLKTSLSLNFKYQNKLTNYISKYKKFIKFKTFIFVEMSLVNILIRSRFLTDHDSCKFLINNGLIFLNGLICTNPNFQLYVGDFLQLMINVKYYILYKWFANLVIKKKYKMRNLIRKKSKPSFSNEDKKKSYHYPKWILFNKNLTDDVAKFIEIDFFSLSLIILYEPFLWSDLNFYNIIDQKFGIINLYNWKYIT